MDKSSIEQQREHFDKIADIYFQARKDPKHLFLKDAMWENFFRGVVLPDSEPLNILEAMCGYAEAYFLSSK